MINPELVKQLLKMGVSLAEKLGNDPDRLDIEIKKITNDAEGMVDKSEKDYLNTIRDKYGFTEPD